MMATRIWNNRLSMPKFQLTFPSLKGSEKQVSWAESIRSSKVNGFINNTAGGMSNFMDCMNDEPSSNIAMRISIISVITSNYAAFWIDNRNNSFNDMLKPFYERNVTFFSK